MNFSFLKKLLPLAGLAIFAYIVMQVGIDNILAAALSSNPLLLLVAVLFIIPVTILQTKKWDYLLKKQGIHEDFLWVLKINLIGIFYSAITPGKIGSFIRINYLKEKRKIGLANASLSVIFDRFFDLAGLSLVSLVGLIMIFRNLEFLFAWILGAFIIFAIPTIIFLHKNLREKFLSVAFGILYQSAPEKKEGTFRLFLSYLENRMDFAYPLLLSVITWLVIFTQTYVVALAFGFNVPFIDFIFILPVAALVSVVPITLAGLGTREAILITLLVPYGESLAAIVSVSLISYVLLVVLESMLGFLISLGEKH